MPNIESLRKFSGIDCCDFPTGRKEKISDNIEIPSFLLFENQMRQSMREWRIHEEEAKRAALIGADRRRQRKKAKEKQNEKINAIVGTLALPIFCTIIALIEYFII